MADRWTTLNIQCKGGLIEDMDSLEQGTNAPGSAVSLINYEPALEGGYARILGFNKYDSTAVPGTGAILGVGVGAGGVVAVRRNGTDYAINFSTGSGWTTVNTPARTGAVTKARATRSSIISDAIIVTDGANHAAKWDGSSYTLINGTGAPANPKYSAVYKNRLCLAGHSADPSELIISEPNSDTLYNGANGAVALPVSDVIVGIRTFRDALYIYCENSIKKLTGSTTADFLLDDVTNSIGCLSGDTIQELGGDILFLSPDGIRSTAATERTNDIELGLVSKEIQPTLREKINIGIEENRYSSLVIRPKSQYRVFINEEGTSTQDQVGFLGRLVQGRNTNGQVQMQWAVTQGFKPYCADSAYLGNQEYAVMGDTSTGYVYRLEQGNSFDGVDIEYLYRTPDITFQSPTTRKVLQKIEVYTQLKGNINVSLRTILDRGVSGIPQPPIQTLTKSGSIAAYGAGVYGTSQYSTFAFPVFKKNLIGGSFVAAFEFSGADQDAPHRIDAMSIIFAQKAYR